MLSRLVLISEMKQSSLALSQDHLFLSLDRVLLCKEGRSGVRIAGVSHRIWL